MENEEKNISYNILLASGAVIAISGAGIYYMYSRNKLINDYINQVEDYERELKEFGKDGKISQDEEKILGQKQQRLQVLEEQIKNKGLIYNLLDELGKLGIIATVSYVTISVIKWLRKKYPPRPPKCPICGQNFTGWTDYRIKKHLEKHYQNHDFNINTSKAPEVWKLIKDLPSWIKDYLAWAAHVPRSYLDKNWDAVPSADRDKIYLAIIWTALLLVAVIIFAIYLTPILATAGVLA